MEKVKKILKKWWIWYWAIAFIFLGPYFINPGEWRAVAGVMCLVLLVIPIFLLTSIVVMIIKDRSAVIKNWRFWILIILLFVNFFVILRPVPHATSTPVNEQFLPVEN